MTTRQPFESHPSTAKPSVFMHSDCRILGAGWLEAACTACHSSASVQDRRHHELVEGVHSADHEYAKTALWVHALASGLRFLRDASTLAKTWPTSPARREKSIPRTLFLGCRTTSTSERSPGRFLRTASRMRRLIRLRSTALPSTRPAVRPMRGPRISDEAWMR